MRLNDILDESILNELTYGQSSSRSNNTRATPQGFLSRVGTGIASTLSTNPNVRNRAKGIASASKEANKLMAEYQKWLGSSGFQGPTKENLIVWMEKQRLPLAGRVKLALDKIVAPASPTPTSPTSPAPSTPTSPTSPAPRIEPTLEDEEAGEIPITNQQVSDILSTSIMDKKADIRSAAPGVLPTTPPAAPGAPSSPSPTSPSSPTTPAPAPATPTITVSDIAKFYNRLDTDGRNKLRQELDMIDAAPAEPAAPTTEGFSRFLGMTL
jgi:hypothetical protein